MQCGRRFTCAATIALAAVFAASASGQTNNNGGSGNVFGAAGVFISPEGVFRVKHATDQTGELTRVRIAEAKTRLGKAVVKGSPLRLISLKGLEASLAERLAAGQEPTDEMNYLAGLTRLQ